MNRVLGVIYRETDRQTSVFVVSMNISCSSDIRKTSNRT